MFGTRRRIFAVTLALAAFGILAAGALGAFWQQQGGDAGRSGHQHVAPTGLPVSFKWQKTGDAPIRTSMGTTAGNSDQNQRVFYGTQGADETAGARVHLQRLADGAPIGNEQGVNIDQGTFDGDTFGDHTNNEVVTPVDTSTESNLGNIFAVHNDDNQDVPGTDDIRRGSDIAIAQIDAETGAKVFGGISDTGETGIGDDETPINDDGSLRPNTINFEIQSSPVITPPDANGTQSIFFTGNRASGSVVADPEVCDPTRDFETPPPEGLPAPQGCDVNAARRLFRVDIANARSPNAEITGVAMSADIADLRTNRAPALVRMVNDEDVLEYHVLLVTAPSSGGAVTLRAYRGSTLTETAATADLGDTNMSAPSVPSNSDGTLAADRPPIFISVGDTGTGAGNENLVVHRIQQDPDTGGLVIQDTSPELPGQPTLGIAVTEAANNTAGPGRVVALSSGTGGAGVYSLDASNLRNLAQHFPTTAPDQDRAIPATSGDLMYYILDNGDQVVRFITSLDEVTGPGQFEESAANDNAGSNTSIGQPAISRRYVQFGTDNGSFVYQAGTQGLPGSTAPAYAINDASTTEGNQGEKLLNFTVTRYGPKGSPSTVRVTTADGSATAGADYRPLNQVVTFAAGESEKTVSVTILSEQTGENDETFFVNLSEPTPVDAQILDGQGIGVIISDDGAAGRLMLVSDVIVTEGQTAQFVVGITSAANENVTVDFTTVSDTARAGVDFGGGAGTLTFTPGQTIKTVSVPIVNDRSAETVERFYVDLANVRGPATVVKGRGTGLILEPDRVAARGLTARTTPRKDTTAPFRFTTTGRLRLPTGMSRATGCAGRVSVQIKAVPRKTISTRRTRLTRSCRYRSTVTFRKRGRFPKSGLLEVRARFLGNGAVLPRKARQHRVDTN